jgi:inhibitor of KinA sporulation pathway (predicted exonuclease)
MTIVKQEQIESEAIDKKMMEMYSSAFTLSDMEIFVFPELLYALVLANIMSPVIWEWRKDPWFSGIEKRSFMQKVNRVKQFIMDNFVFNLDLDTWGLTSQEKELDRFDDFLDRDTIARSNALFGYEGDKYYFDIDIRKHFGLDKYTGDVIPYWKTETAEAMKAFIYKKNYTTGAGECVSLSTLYAAALFIIARIPLEKIFLLATPLHSQNFIDEKDGVLTNNRRIVTKNMWSNGTTISSKARRALENEEVTIVSHLSGYIHTVYPGATIDPDIYSTFKHSLAGFLTADMKPEIMSSFLRRENRFQCCFQYCHIMHGKKTYIKVERIYTYEHSSPNSFSTDSRAALLKEIDAEEFNFTPLADRIVLNEFEEYIKNHPDLQISQLDKIMMDELYIEKCPKMEDMFKHLKAFLYVEPRLPGTDKEFIDPDRISIPVTLSRQEVINLIKTEARDSKLAYLALFAYRDMENIPWEPYLKAAIERNPVSIEGFEQKSMDDIINELHSMDTASIYSGNRLALPDEVWNYQRGDGIEKAVLLANVIKCRDPKSEVTINISEGAVELISGDIAGKFETSKNLPCKITL